MKNVQIEKLRWITIQKDVEIQDLKAEIEELEEKLLETCEYADRLEHEIERRKTNEARLRKVNRTLKELWNATRD